MTWQCSGIQANAVHAHLGSHVIGLGSIIATIILVANDASSVVPVLKMSGCQQYYILILSQHDALLQ